MSLIRKYLEEKSGDLNNPRLKAKIKPMNGEEDGDKKEDDFANEPEQQDDGTASRQGGLGVRAVTSADYKIGPSGKKIPARRIVFNKGEDDGRRGLGEELSGEMHPDAHKVLKHIKPEHHSTYKPFLKKGTYNGSYRDRADVLSAAEKAGHVKEEVVEEEMTDSQMKKREEYVKGMKKKYSDFVNKYGADRAKSVMYATATKMAMKEESELEEELSGEMHPDANKVLKHIKPEHHSTYKPFLKKGTYNGSYKDRSDVLSAAEKAGHIKEDIVEGWDDMMSDVKKRAANAPKSTTLTHHDVKKTSTGTVYTKQHDKDGISKGTGAPETEQKRGRGRPKKDKFAEAIEFLMDLPEDQFDEAVSEGLDAFFESFLEEGKGYAPGWMLKADPKLGKKIDDVKKKHKAIRNAMGKPEAGVSAKKDNK